MSARPVLVSLLTSLLLAACTTAPTRPAVMVLPGSGKSLEQFDTDDTACRAWATRRPGGPETQDEYDMAYLQCMYARGHQIPVSRGAAPAYTAPPESPQAPASRPADVPPPPAGSPPPPPSGAPR